MGLGELPISCLWKTRFQKYSTIRYQKVAETVWQSLIITLSILNDSK